MLKVSCKVAGCPKAARTAKCCSRHYDRARALWGPSEAVRHLHTSSSKQLLTSLGAYEASAAGIFKGKRGYLSKNTEAQQEVTQPQDVRALAGLREIIDHQAGDLAQLRKEIIEQQEELTHRRKQAEATTKVITAVQQRERDAYAENSQLKEELATRYAQVEDLRKQLEELALEEATAPRLLHVTRVSLDANGRPRMILTGDGVPASAHLIGKMVRLLL